MAPNSLGDALRDFSVDLYKQLLPKSGDAGNIFYSPFSISAALSMALAGARKKTAKQLSRALHANSDKIHKHFSRFLSHLPGFAPDVKLHLANRMYSEKTFVVMESYLTVLRDVYGATIESVDFQNHSEEVRQQVNAWVEEATASKIKDLLPGGSVDSRRALYS
ncbi:hypothetical protein HPB48_027047 [Haemaphysalis longicornis]|uniref:Serpin domain-containing protein n=1 Tax=Haemaphysalis longicornis TaxID=44386 RepID=A0A9J6HB75_HAELO|nr:hypothetical protein HPB48_027047 [Haemaphysalis longicornis]